MEPIVRGIILNVSGGETVDCLKYAGYVINIGEGATAPVVFEFNNLQPGAVFHLYATSGDKREITVPSGALIYADGATSGVQTFDLDSFNSPASTLVIVSKTIVGLVGS